MSDFTPGIITDEPEAVYHARQEVSNSMLKTLKDKSAYHFWAQHVATPPLVTRKATAALETGRALHLLVLEPHNFAKAFHVAPDIRRGTKAWDAVEAQAGDRSILKQSEYDATRRMADAVLSHPTVAEILSSKGHSECTMLWTDPATQINCRGRADFIGIERQCFLDIKSTRSAHPFQFGKSIAEYGYHRQAVLYPDGAEAAGLAGASSWPFIWAAVEAEAPYYCETYVMPEADIDLAREQVERLLERLKKCRDENYWPGYVDRREATFGVVNIPSWAYSNNPHMEQI